MTRLVVVPGLSSISMLWVLAASLGAQTPPQPKPTVSQPSDPHAGHGQKPADGVSAPSPSPADLPAFIPRPTEEDRRAAFSDVAGHAVHDRAVHLFVLFDQFEWRAADDFSGAAVDSKGWIGQDRDRIWFRVEGTGDGGDVGAAEAHVLYGRKMWRWWDLVAGVRQDVRPDPAQTWAAVGIQGIAPYWFSLEATGYIGASGRTQARFDVEYDLLLTNRLVLQPTVEIDVAGKSDSDRGVGAGLSTTDAGLRVRYEFRRELAPYIGVTWHRKYFGTADFAREAGQDTSSAHVTVGVRFWF